MEKRKCLYCNTPLPETKRADSKFCNNSCKAWYWEKNKGNNTSKPAQQTAKPIQEAKKEQVVKGTPLEGLRGVIDHSQTEDLKQAANIPNLTTDKKPSGSVVDLPPTDTKEETEAYKQAKEKVQEWMHTVNRLYGDIRYCEEELKKVEVMQDSNSPKRNTYGKTSFKNLDAQFAYDFDWLNEPIRQEKETEFSRWKKQRLQTLREGKAKLPSVLEGAMNELKKAREELLKTPQYKPQPKPLRKAWADLFKPKTPNLLKTDVFPLPSELKQQEVKQSQANESTSTEPTQPETKVATNERILSSEEVLKINHKTLVFQGRWKEFLGQPAPVFHTAVHGLPGGGKSTFCLQFSEYLAKNFGRVIYICGEEGYSKTLKEKLQRNKINSPHLYFHDAKTYDDIKLYVPNDRFHFIVIDSLDTLRIDAARLKELKEFYPQSAFVTISQSRKDGKMKGDNEILHDADTVIAVHKGVAVTSKNRYAPSDKCFEVFPTEKENSKGNGLSELRNVV